MGRPTVVSGPLAVEVFLSLSHKDCVAVSVASDRPVGIDLERFTAVFDPDGLSRQAFTAAESALIADAGWADSELVAIPWAAKEAAAKSLGQKLLGHEKSLIITMIDPAQAMMRLAYADGWVDVFYAVDGDFVCTLAAPTMEARRASNPFSAAVAGPTSDKQDRREQTASR
jgi:4'-phosphopantetheinyl transferase EntD